MLLLSLLNGCGSLHLNAYSTLIMLKSSDAFFTKRDWDVRSRTRYNAIPLAGRIGQ